MIMELGFDSQLPLLLLLKDAVGTGESVHGGTGGWGARRRHRRNFPGCPVLTTTSTAASSATNSPDRAARVFSFLPKTDFIAPLKS